MGSSYLLAHGLGKPVDNARTQHTFAEGGTYHVWVRAKDWVPSHHPGRFRVLIDGKALPVECGANGKDWNWERCGRVEIKKGPVTIELKDGTGFDGRCDAIFFTTDAENSPPAQPNEKMQAWRLKLLGLPEEPVNAGEFDVVVVGGGVAGCAAALSAARLGPKVALIQNRPVLGGNASIEVGIGPGGQRSPLVDELTQRREDGDLVAGKVLSDSGVKLFLEHHAFRVVMDGSRIKAVDARHARSGVVRRFCAPVFIDCTGRAAVGLLAGADTRFGREACAEFNEGLAPEKADKMHHGNTVTFRTKSMREPVDFPDVPWAAAVAKDWADLGGQIGKPGHENVAGPVAGNRRSQRLTHFWEYGQWLDPYKDDEAIRDHLLCAIYGTFANVKRMEPKKYANLALAWVAHVPATGEYHRYVGDYILTENDIRSGKKFDDAVALNSWNLCLHYPGEKYDFRLGNWQWIKAPNPRQIPFRCLYSRNIENLMVAGKHISASHVASSNTKMMFNGGQHGFAVGSAAALCKKYNAMPREVRQKHIRELQELIARKHQFRKNSR